MLDFYRWKWRIQGLRQAWGTFYTIAAGTIKQVRGSASARGKRILFFRRKVVQTTANYRKLPLSRLDYFLIANMNEPPRIGLV